MHPKWIKDAVDFIEGLQAEEKRDRKKWIAGDGRDRARAAIAALAALKTKLDTLYIGP